MRREALVLDGYETLMFEQPEGCRGSCGMFTKQAIAEYQVRIREQKKKTKQNPKKRTVDGDS
jgi:hypothetical protein